MPSPASGRKVRSVDPHLRLPGRFQVFGGNHPPAVRRHASVQLRDQVARHVPGGRPGAAGRHQRADQLFQLQRDRHESAVRRVAVRGGVVRVGLYRVEREGRAGHADRVEHPPLHLGHVVGVQVAGAAARRLGGEKAAEWPPSGCCLKIPGLASHDHFLQEQGVGLSSSNNAWPGQRKRHPTGFHSDRVREPVFHFDPTGMNSLFLAY